jgi:hypothetical protein
MRGYFLSRELVFFYQKFYKKAMRSQINYENMLNVMAGYNG